MESGKVKPRSILDFLFSSSNNKFILNWDLNGDEIYMNQQDQTSFYTFRYLKQMVTNICKIFPTIILNSENKEKINRRSVPKHWKLKSGRINNQIINLMKEEYQGFNSFYDNNKLIPVLKYVSKNSNDLLTLMNVIPFYANIDEDTTFSSDATAQQIVTENDVK